MTCEDYIQYALFYVYCYDIFVKCDTGHRLDNSCVKHPLLLKKFKQFAQSIWYFTHNNAHLVFKSFSKNDTPPQKKPLFVCLSEDRMTDSSNAQARETLGATDINNIAKLAHLLLNDEESARYAASLNNILSMMDHLQTVDTTGIEPLKNPFDSPQPLRNDIPTEPNRREAYQAVAPATQDGLYLVPKVLD